MDKAKWIWVEGQDVYAKDVYAEFKINFQKNGRKQVLKISADSAFCAYVNGELVGFSLCADYPHYKLYDEYDVTAFCKDDNELRILVWHFGEDSQTYLNAAAGVRFVVDGDETRLVQSDERTLGRICTNFKNGYCKVITYQLGYSFFYDNTVCNDNVYTSCQIVEKPNQVFPRPQKTLRLTKRADVTYTILKDRLRVDMGKECAGYLDVDFESPIEQTLTIAFGEHLGTGEVARRIGDRDFTVEFRTKKGRNRWFCPLRRLAGRYLDVYFEKEIAPEYFGLKLVEYPVTVKEKKFADPLMQKIYDISIATLRLCMHEHYEDCPWREQALYTMDSRNQMLFGYYAFEETEYQRANLLLISEGLRKDGLLSLCFPSGVDIPIPSFSLAFVLQACEYLAHTKDESVREKLQKTAKTILSTFVKRRGENGLIATLPYPYWNFYEWTEGNHREEEITRSVDAPYREDYDLILNAFFVYAAEKYNKIFGFTWNTEDMKCSIQTQFYDETAGLYINSILDKRASQLGNALAVLIGLGNAELIEKLANADGMTRASLSMSGFVYDALLTRGERYRSFVLEDIKRRYKAMLDEGATSFWETDSGWKDFNGAGSLCHGWSALPVYYFSILQEE